MPDVSVQFYALPNELVQFATEIATEFNLHLTAMRSHPFEVVRIEPPDFKAFLEKQPEHRRLAFSIEMPDLDVAHELEFGSANPDHLRLDIARQTMDGLGESWLSARTQNPDAIRLWRRIAARLKRWKYAGIRGINRETGFTVVYKSFQYSDGAKELEVSGVPMIKRPGGRGPFIKLGA